ncbi:MAG: prepilin peptidase [Spirochaetes bacterium]|nr:MAG: prepilin peptidase [Spirochaetota bacterium]
MAMSAPLGIAIFFAGALWGSFFFTLALRLSDESYRGKTKELLFTRSRCPHCGAPVSIAGLVPLFGYLFLRGRCASCAGNILWSYPAAEVAFGLVAVAVCVRFGFSLDAACVFFALAIAMCVSIIDIKTLSIPGSLCAMIALVSVYPVVMDGMWKSHLLGAAGMFVFFAVFMLIFPGSFGGGDVKFAAALGFLAGLEQGAVLLESALVIGSIAGVIYALASGKGLRIKFPFAPPLTAGLAVSLFWGDAIMRAYLTFFP